MVSRVFPQLAVASTYGEATGTSQALIAELAEFVDKASRAVTVVIGDVSWKPQWKALEAKGFTMPKPIYTTKGTGGTPTRCYTMGAEARPVQTWNLPGAPHHLMVVYEVDIPAVKVESQKSPRFKKVSKPHLA